MTNSGLTIFICKAYLVSCLVVVMFGLFYVLGDLPQIERYKLIAIQAVALGILIVGTTIIYVLVCFVRKNFHSCPYCLDSKKILAIFVP